jgi:hypothetical protein
VSPSNRLVARAAVAVVAAGALVLPVVASAQTQAAAATPTASPSATALAAQVRQEVRSGTLLHSHGVHQVCAACQAEVVTTGIGSDQPLSTSLPAGYGPKDLATAYDLPSSSTSTTTIAIIDAGVDGTA